MPKIKNKTAIKHHVRTTLPLLLLFLFNSPLFSADRLLFDVLRDYAQAYHLSFTIEYIPPIPTVHGGWQSKPVVGSGTIDPAGDPMVARAALERGLGDWLVVPSQTRPRVWHVIDRQLLNRSPMDGFVSKLTFAGTASVLVDVLEKIPALRVAGPRVFAAGEIGRGAPVQLTDFSGPVRDALTVSFARDDEIRQTVQWVAECQETANHDIAAILYVQPAKKRKVTPADSAAPLLTTEEGNAVDAVLAEAMTLGFPEVRGAQWHAPSSSIFKPFDLALSRGDWLLGGWMLRDKQAQGTPPSDIGQVWKELGLQRPPGVTKTPEIEWSLLRVGAQDLPRLQQSADVSLMGFLSVLLPGWGLENRPGIALPGVILRRFGHPELGDRLLIQAQYQRTRAEYGLCFSSEDIERLGGYETPARAWDERLSSLLLLHYENSDRWVASVKQKSVSVPPIMTMIPLVTVLRRELHWWFREQLIQAKPERADEWANAALIILDEPDRARVQDDLARLAARAKIAEYPTPNVGLAERLAAWDVGPFSTFEHWPFSTWDDYKILSPEAYRKHYVDSTFPGLNRRKRAYDQWTIFASLAQEPDAVDTLVNLLSSTAPCRWLENGTPRLLGDNALRALTVIWSVDPRVLVGRDRFAPWTDAERSATALAVQTWWKTARESGIHQVICAQLEQVPAWSIVRCYQRSSAAQRAELITALARVWEQGPPMPRDRQQESDLDKCLAQLCSDKKFAVMVRGWEMVGPQANMVLLARELVGDTAPLDAHLQKIIDQSVAQVAQKSQTEPNAQAVNAQLSEQLASGFALACSRLTPFRARLLLQALRADLTSPSMRAVVRALSDGRSGDSFSGGTEIERRVLSRTTKNDLRALLNWVWLGDQRPAADLGDELIPEELRQTTNGMPAALVCDVALISLIEQQRKQNEKTPTTSAEFARQTRTQRDVLITAQRAELVASASLAATQIGLTSEAFQQLGLPEQKSDF
jgi:hypothetical protein